jgi:hypothetical protein
LTGSETKIAIENDNLILGPQQIETNTSEDKIYFQLQTVHNNQAINEPYSLSSERLVDIKITKFYAEKVVPSARKIVNISFKQ